MNEVAGTAATLITNVATAAVEKYRKHTPLVDMLVELNTEKESLIALQKDKGREAWSDVTQKDTTSVFKLWMDRVSKIGKEVTSLNDKYKELQIQRVKYRKKRRLRKEIKRALDEVKVLVGECPEKFLVDKQAERVIKEIDVPSIENCSTLKNALNFVKSLLRGERVKCVALHGQKGVGKTTIIRHLNNYFYDKMVFDLVIFIKVSTNEHTDLHILQEIADRINVGREVTNFDEVARRIQKVLEKNRYLLVLDDIRQPPDGIWRMLDITNDKKNSKVVITTCYRRALMSNRIDQRVELQPLPSNEAVDMFQDIAGNNSLPDRRIARLLCNRLCFGLPLLIDPIARYFKFREPPIIWEEVLEEFTLWPQVQVNGLKELCSNLKICYEPLDQNDRDIFLFASLYPANSKIYTHYLVECCIVQGFLKVAGTSKYSAMRQAIHTTLGRLVHVAFLEGGEQMRYVKMNDFFRQFALFMSSRYSYSECRTCVENEDDGEDEKRPSTPDSWQHVRWASMIGSKRVSLPTNRNCRNLQTLLLQKSINLVEIPLDYFKRMGSLLVLNLHGTRISRLPSLKGLKKLKAFYLNGCSRLTICSEEVEKLKRLEIFDIRDTRVNTVPCLKSLRCLRISNFVGDYHSISKLQNLEELVIEVKFPEQWCNNAKCIVEKVASLKNLTTFRCSFPSSESLKEFEETKKSWRGEKQLLDFNFSCCVKTQNIQNGH